MYDLIVDEEIEHLLPPLSKEEFSNLESDILKNGVREPIIVWAGHGIIADGYNRYHICERHGIRYPVMDMEFADRTELAEWVCKNQKSRRNMTKGQEADVAIRLNEIRLREEARQKQVVSGRENIERYNRRRSEGTTSSDQLVGTSGDGKDNANEQTQPVSPSAEAPQPIGQQSQDTEPRDASNGGRRTSRKARENETAHRIAKEAGVGVGTVKRVMAVRKSGEQDLIDGVHTGEMSANEAYETMRRRKQESVAEPVQEDEPGQAIIYARSGVGVTEPCDLLVTEVPSGMGPDSWMYAALSGVRRDGHAYVFVDPEPDNLISYLGASIPMNVELAQVLVWSFDYVIGNNDRSGYKPSWKAILYFRGADAHDLRFSHIKERNAVHSVDAEGGDTGDKEYKLLMPMELARRLVRQSTREGDLVFDPFAGNGTFLLAAMDFGRDAIGYERDESMVEAARSRGIEVGE